jgi:hypothetical protein
MAHWEQSRGRGAAPKLASLSLLVGKSNGDALCLHELQEVVSLMISIPWHSLRRKTPYKEVPMKVT